MPSKSQAQQKFMGMVHAVQQGKEKAPSKEVAEVAKSISKTDATHFAETKRKGLPERVKSAGNWFIGNNSQGNIACPNIGNTTLAGTIAGSILGAILAKRGKRLRGAGTGAVVGGLAGLGAGVGATFGSVAGGAAGYGCSSVPEATTAPTVDSILSAPAVGRWSHIGANAGLVGGGLLGGLGGRMLIKYVEDDNKSKSAAYAFGLKCAADARENKSQSESKPTVQPSSMRQSLSKLYPFNLCFSPGRQPQQTNDIPKDVSIKQPVVVVKR